jgi:3-mercaptopyruvate sulfurtransferase SseA
MGDYLRADGTVKPADDLTALLRSKGITQGKTVIACCPSGYRAGRAYLVFRLMGYTVADYDGSWAERSADSSVPTEP